MQMGHRQQPSSGHSQSKSNGAIGQNGQHSTSRGGQQVSGSGGHQPNYVKASSPTDGFKSGHSPQRTNRNIVPMNEVSMANMRQPGDKASATIDTSSFRNGGSIEMGAGPLNGTRYG
eukprot:CAMPEP_0170482174 /NCGR_PEP_ID=MMETSP0208-20121228/2307_1 /TAXON_ID=197538 /ORGANISM="Strombidium inclinatum, Strain S3" /LENGTH=116 /DNA_ID=CAMNT_0010754981 /DNA_START=307 /DNA_END=657 /DNA_ORIENTATION=-